MTAGKLRQLNRTIKVAKSVLAGVEKKFPFRMRLRIHYLFLICLILAPIRASSFAPNRKKRNLLRDSENYADAVPLSYRRNIAPKAPKKKPAPQVNEEVCKEFKELMERGAYGEVIELGKNMNHDTYLNHICPIMTTIEDYKGFLEHLKHREILPDFLAHGNMTLVRKAIVEYNVYGSEYYLTEPYIHEAINLSLKEDRHDRATALFEAAKERSAKEDKRRRHAGKATEFEAFMHNFFVNLAPKKDSIPLKRFLTLHGRELNRTYPDISELFCQKLVSYLSIRLDAHSSSKKLLSNLIKQPSILTTTAFITGFSGYPHKTLLTNFTTYAWRGAAEEGLRGKYSESKHFWIAISKKCPRRISGTYPPPDSERELVMGGLKPRRSLRTNRVGRMYESIDLHFW